MGKLIILSSFFVVGSLFIGQVGEALDLESLEICYGLHSSKETADTLESRQELLPGSLKVGYTCKVARVETDHYSKEGYVPWTLVKRDGDKQIWSARTQEWGPIYVGYVEPDHYTFVEAKEICNREEEIKLDGKSLTIAMTLPEFGFGKTRIDEPLNFELMTHFNYTSIMPDEDGKWFWASAPGYRYGAWLFSAAYPSLYSDLYYTRRPVRCVGR